MIAQELHEIQHQHGYLPKQELRILAERLEVPLFKLHDVASSFPHFRTTPPAEVEVQICRDMACHHAGAKTLIDEATESCRKTLGEQRVKVKGVSCLGRCDRAIAGVVQCNAHTGHSHELVYTQLSLERVMDIVNKTVEKRRLPHGDRDGRYPACSPLPWTIDPYTSGRKPYAAVRQYAPLAPERMLGEDFSKTIENHPITKALRRSNLLGMGGAGVPAATKWKDVAVAKGEEKYIICNADESEPSTFKDRELLLRTPHLVLEGVIVAGILTGASKGYIYIRHEYTEQIDAMNACIDEAKKIGACGDRLFNTDISFPVEVFTSPGGYICGEQSALIEAMSDRRAEPRNRPPDLATNGYLDKPTLVSNVETFSWVPSILVRTENDMPGGEWYASQGVSGFKGRRFLSVCGDLKRPGVYEIAIGSTLRELIEGCCLGVPDGMELYAVATSGPSGGFLPAKIPLSALPSNWARSASDTMKAKLQGKTELDILDLELDLNLFRAFGLMLGAGLAVYGSGTNIVDEALNATEFFRNESCGKCVPCRLGSQKLVEIGTRILNGGYEAEKFEEVNETVLALGPIMELTSICGLGQVAPGPMLSLLKFFPQEVARYLKK